MILFAAAAAAAVLAAALTPLAPGSEARAADGRQFDPGNIISNETFFNSAAMTADQVQAFLNAQVVNCRPSGQPCLKDYRQATQTRAATAYCSQYTGSGSQSAAEIIVNVGRACGINPQVLLVTLQKERGLVTKTTPTAGDYQISMGFACPDTAPCDTQYYGFFNQVYSAASQFQRYTKSPNSWNYRPGRTNAIQYHPNAACGSSQVYIQNQATANLYIYTPYQPNAAALNNMYGLGDGCSSYGNRNFWAYFTDWFGNPSNWLQAPSFEGGSFSGWGSSNGFINQAVYNNAAVAQDGNWFFAANTPVAGRAVSQDVFRTTNIGEQAVASVWLRSSDATPFQVDVAVWGLGGTTEMQHKKVTIGSTWQQVTVKLPVRQSAHSLVRLDIYMVSTTGTLFIDNASMQFTPAPPPQNLVTGPGFEGTFAGWGPGNGFVNQQIYNDPSTAHGGSWFAASNTPVAGRSFAQVMTVSPGNDDVYDFSIWLRSSDPSRPFSGMIALWGLGGNAATVATTAYTVGGTWTQVKVSLDTAATQTSIVKAEVYMNSTDATLWLDDAQVSKNQLTAGSFEGGSFEGWQRSAGDVNVAVYKGSQDTPAKARDYFAATNSPRTGESVYQDADVETVVGDVYTAELWVRAPQGYQGTLALWALGGSATEGASAPFTANGTWQLVSFTLPIRVDGHTVLRYQIYSNTVGNTLFFDGAQTY